MREIVCQKSERLMRSVLFGETFLWKRVREEKSRNGPWTLCSDTHRPADARFFRLLSDCSISLIKW